MKKRARRVIRCYGNGPSHYHANVGSCVRVGSLYARLRSLPVPYNMEQETRHIFHAKNPARIHASINLTLPTKPSYPATFFFATSLLKKYCDEDLRE